MSPLASWKQLRVAESGLNRAQLVRECRLMADDVSAFLQQVKSLRTIVSALVSLISRFKTPKPAPAGEKSSWRQTLLKGAQTAGSLWSQFRPAKK